MAKRKAKKVEIPEVIWMRLGDGGEYEAHDDLDSVADTLAEFRVREIEPHCQYGVSASGFTGHNYISLYWGPNPGDDSAEASRDLTDEEIAGINKRLEKLAREYGFDEDEDEGSEYDDHLYGESLTQED